MRTRLELLENQAKKYVFEQNAHKYQVQNMKVQVGAGPACTHEGLLVVLYWQISRCTPLLGIYCAFRPRQRKARQTSAKQREDDGEDGRRWLDGKGRR